MRINTLVSCVALALAGTAAVHAIHKSPAKSPQYVTHLLKGNSTPNNGPKVFGAVAIPNPGTLNLTNDHQLMSSHYRNVASHNARAANLEALSFSAPKIVRGNVTKRELALTFDDGPHPVYTRQLVKTLQRLHVAATFFVVGKQVQKYPNLVQWEAACGYEIGNHTYDHVDLAKATPEKVAYEIDHCDMAIKAAVGVSARFFRPPGGQFNDQVIREAMQRHYITTLWTSDPGDYAKPGADVVLQRSIDRFENGAILLMHDGMPETISILPTLVAEAHKRGFEFVTLSRLVHDL